MEPTRIMPKRKASVLSEDAVHADKAQPKASKRQLEAQDFDALLKRKWKDAYDANPVQFRLDADAPPGRKDSQPRTLHMEKDEQPVFYMVCVVCQDNKPTLSAYYTNYDGKQRALDAKPGREYWFNSATNPCNACRATLKAAHRSTVDGWVDDIMRSYPQLRPPAAGGYAPTPVGWFWWRWRNQGGEFEVNGDATHNITRAAQCNLSKVPLVLFGRQNAFCASVNNTRMANKKPADHESDDCELICAELNVSQHDAIPVLADGFRELCVGAVAYLELRVAHAAATKAAAAGGVGELKDEAADAFVAECTRNWDNRNNTKLNGVTAYRCDRAAYEKQRRDLNLATILHNAVQGHSQRDAKVGRENNMSSNRMYALLLRQPRCAISRALFTIRNGPLRFSLERLDNSIGHVETNCVLVSRLLNDAVQMTRGKFLVMLLAQELVPLSRSERAEAERELAEEHVHPSAAVVGDEDE